MDLVLGKVTVNCFRSWKISLIIFPPLLGTRSAQKLVDAITNAPDETYNLYRKCFHPEQSEVMEIIMSINGKKSERG